MGYLAERAGTLGAKEIPHPLTSQSSSSDIICVTKRTQVYESRVGAMLSDKKTISNLFQFKRAGDVKDACWSLSFLPLQMTTKLYKFNRKN